MLCSLNCQYSAYAITARKLARIYDRDKTSIKPGRTLIFRTSGWAMISAVRAGAVSFDMEIKLRTPGGSPASSKSSTTIAWLLGLYSEDLRTIVLPHKMGTEIARKESVKGAFQGAMAKLKVASN